MRLRNQDSGYEHGIKADTLLYCIRCPLQPEDVRKVSARHNIAARHSRNVLCCDDHHSIVALPQVFVTARVAELPIRRGGLTISVSDGAHTKRRDFTAKAFLPMLRDGTCNVCTLKLSNCGVSDLGCTDLAEGLKANKTLRHLVLSQNDIGDDGIGTLSAMLARNRVLESLDLSNNPKIGDEGILDLCEVSANGLAAG